MNLEPKTPIHLKRLESTAVPSFFEKLLMTQIKNAMVKNLTQSNALRRLTEVAPNKKLARFQSENNMPLNI